VSHESPTTENWKNYFVGYTQLKDYAWSALEPGQKIDVLSIPALEGQAQSVATLLPGDEPDSFEANYQPEAKSRARLAVQSTVKPSYEDEESGF